jgi:hypothetical protein
MKLTLLPWAVAPALMAPLLLSDTSASAPANGLVRVHAQSSGAPNTPDVAAWKDRLTARDLDQREAAYAEFVEALRRDPALAKTAQDWRDGSDSDLAWTARLALREAQGANDGSPFRSRLRGPGLGQNDLRSRLDDMQRQFGDLDRMFEDFERRLNPNSGGMAPFTHNGSTDEHQGYSIEVTPDGVKVEVEENVGGKSEKKTYEAKSLEELYDAHPELKDKIGAHVGVFQGPHAWWQNDKDDDFFNGPALPPSGGGARTNPPLPLSGGMRTDRLGVGIGDISADDRQAAHLEDGVGLKVASIEPNSVASKIGIEVGDVLVDVNGRKIKGAPDVLEVLAQRRADQDIVVTLVDQDGKTRTLTWRASKSSGKNAPDKRQL